MYARCPKCHTLFRIRGAQLKAALGYVRCGKCEHLFNALHTLTDTVDEGAVEAGPSPRPLRNKAVERDVPRDRASDTNGTTTALPLPFDVPDDLPEIEPSELLPELSDSRSHRGWRSMLLWFSATAVLAIMAVAQLAWHEREQLATHAEGRRILETLCRIVGCEVPYRRDPSEFRVLERYLGTSPDRPQTLQFRLDFVNEAEFPQPYPGIEVSLYSDDDKLAARRTFTPREYLELPHPDTLMEPGSRAHASLDLAEPAERITGFRLEFD